MCYSEIMKKVNRYYNIGYNDYGKAEAVTLELLTKEQVNDED